MHHLKDVYDAIRSQCTAVDTPVKNCIIVLEKMKVANDIAYPIPVYLDMLVSLGVIKYNTETHVISVTEKGWDSDSLSWEITCID